MDEKTQLLAARFPEEVVAWLSRVAEFRGWRLSRTLRWAVRQTMEQDIARAELEGLAKYEAERSLAEARAAFPDDLPDNQN